jgi:PilZ domain
VPAPPISRSPAPPPIPQRAARRPTDPREILEALRTPDRPPMAPRPPDPPDASPRAQRTSVPIDIRLVMPDGTRVNGHSRDISTSGLFVLAADVWFPIGTELHVELLLPSAEAFVENEFRARARIARRDDDGIGIELIDPDPALLEALAGL